LIIQSCHYNHKRQENESKTKNINTFDSIWSKRKKDLKKYNNYDFFSHNYKYIDSKNYFKIINVTPSIFDSFIKKHHYNPMKINSHKDSIGVLLSEEFDSFVGRRSAYFTIFYSWKRLSNCVYIKPEKLMQWADSLGIKHPYKFRELIVEQKEAIARQITQQLKDSLVKITHDNHLKDIEDIEKIISISLKNNPSLRSLHHHMLDHWFNEKKDN